MTDQAPNTDGMHAQDIARVERKVDELAAEIRSLVEAWDTARGVVRFVKVLSNTVTAVTAAVAGVWAIIHFGSAK